MATRRMPPCPYREHVIGALVPGFLAGLTLIVAIGAQNAFVLRQGLRREHVFLVVAICALSDLALIVAGVAGIGTVIERAPGAITVVRWAGAAFLLVYGLLAARRAIRGQDSQDVAAGEGSSRKGVIATALAFTWLNPHVYLDTVLLLGSMASTHGEPGRWWFAAGAGAASIVWFSSLGYGARLLAPIFRRPIAWRILDAIIAVVMIALALSLVL